MVESTLPRLELLRKTVPTLEDHLIQEIIDNYDEFIATDFEERDDESDEEIEEKQTIPNAQIETRDIGVIQGMLIAMGCDANRETTRALYDKVKKQVLHLDQLTLADEQFEKYILNLEEYAQMVSLFVEEQCDPVDGVIEAVKERFDPEGTKGSCKHSELLLFLQEHDYLGGEEQAVKHVLGQYRIGEDMIDYVNAIKSLIY